jgi:hypothetical protein
MENLDQLPKLLLPASPPPPPQMCFSSSLCSPVVVDSVKPEEEVQLMTADQASVEVQDQEVVEEIAIVAEEIEEGKLRKLNLSWL